MKYSDTKGPISLSSVPQSAIGHAVPGSKRDVESAVIKVTPEMAREWLKRNRSNRKVREGRVDRYAEQMEDGDWLVSPDAIAFSHTGKLINGQHRLKAITQLEEGSSVQCLVVFGLDPAAFKIADVGVKRTGADVLRIEGFKSAEEMAAVCRLLALWKQERLEELHRYENVRNSVIVDIATACRNHTGGQGNSRLVGTIEKTGKTKKALEGKMPRSLMAFAYFAYLPTFPTRAEYFFNGFLYGQDFPAENWAKTYDDEKVKNPISALKDKMRAGNNYKNFSRKKKLALLVKAMNKYCLQKPLKQLRWRSNEDFPELAAHMVPELS